MAVPWNPPSSVADLQCTFETRGRVCARVLGLLTGICNEGTNVNIAHEGDRDAWCRVGCGARRLWRRFWSRGTRARRRRPHQQLRAASHGAAAAAARGGAGPGTARRVRGVPRPSPGVRQGHHVRHRCRKGTSACAVLLFSRQHRPSAVLSDRRPRWQSLTAFICDIRGAVHAKEVADGLHGCRDPACVSTRACCTATAATRGSSLPSCRRVCCTSASAEVLDHNAVLICVETS